MARRAASIGIGGAAIRDIRQAGAGGAFHLDHVVGIEKRILQRVSEVFERKGITPSSAATG